MQTAGAQPDATWLNIQSNYLRQLQGAIDRVLAFDSQLERNVMWNAQRNFNVFTSNNLTVGTNNLTQIAVQGEEFLTQIFPGYRWMLYAYNNTKSASLVSWRCSNCFVSYAPRVNYTILVFGVPMSDLGNTDALSQINQANTLDQFTAANDLVESVFDQNLCIQGAFSVWNTVQTQGAWSPQAVGFLGNGLKVVQDMNTKGNPMVAVWSTQSQGCRQMMAPY